MVSVPEYFINNYNEVKVPNADYSKLVTSDGRVAVLYSPGYGSGWSTHYYKNKHQLIFDSRIILYVLSSQFQSYFDENATREELFRKYHRLMLSVFPDAEEIPSLDAFKQLSVAYLPLNTMFRINEYDGSESIEEYNPDLYFVA